MSGNRAKFCEATSGDSRAEAGRFVAPFGAPRAGVSRRTVLRQAAAAWTGALLASGCRDLGGKALTLRFWNGFTGADGRTVLKIIRDFNARHDDVQVIMQRMEWGTYYNKVFVAAMSNRAPDLFVVHTDTMQRFLYAGLLAPAEELFTSGALDRSDLDANVLAGVSRNGVAYAMPLDCHPVGVFYNRKLFAEAGIAKPPENRDEFVDALTRLKRPPTAGPGTAHWGFCYEWVRLSLYTLVAQWGGSIVGDDGLTITFDSPEVRGAMQWAGDLIHELKLAAPIENIDAFLGFRQGRVGMVWSGIFRLTDATRQKDLDFGAAMIPQIGAQYKVWAGSHNVCFRKGLDERKLTAAHRFAAYLSDNSLDWADGGQVPVRPSLRATERFKAMTVQSTFAKQLPYLAYMPSTPFAFEYQTEFDIACERVLRGSMTAEQAVPAAAANMRRAATKFAGGTAPGVGA